MPDQWRPGGQDVEVVLHPGVRESFAAEAARNLLGQRTRVKVDGRAVPGRITAARVDDAGDLRVTVRVF